MSALVTSEAAARRTFALLALASVVGLAGIDLVLPAVPGLSAHLGGTPALSQLVLATFVAGNGVGLVLFGALGARFPPRQLLVGALAAFAGLSALATLAPDLTTLIVLRFVQGMAAAAAPVFAPGMIRQVFRERGAIRALGALGSIESGVPAFAPIVGIWLLGLGGWRVSFVVLALAALVTTAAMYAWRRALPVPEPAARDGSYRRLLTSRVFARYALSQACILAALLVTVLSAPAVITLAMGGTLSDFVVMQLSGITTFVVSANLTDRVVARVGAERVIFFGSLLSAAGAGAIFAYGALGGASPRMLAILFVPLNMGLGFRGPPGFFHAVLAARGDDARGSALVLLGVLGLTASGTALAARWVTVGLAPVAAVALALALAGVFALVVLPELDSDDAR